MDSEPLAVTVAQAARMTGLSKTAMQRRVDRGTVAHFTEGGIRYIPLPDIGPLLDPAAAARLIASLRLTAALLAGGEEVAPSRVIADLLDRLERQAEELGRLRRS